MVLGARFHLRAVLSNAEMPSCRIDACRLGKNQTLRAAIQADVDDDTADLIPLVTWQPRAEWHQLLPDLQRELSNPESVRSG